MNNNKVFTKTFYIMCVSSFFFFMSFNMILPELNGFLTELGGEKYKGLIVALFTLTAGLSRPFSGKIADRVGRIPTMIFGGLISTVAAIAYIFIENISAFLFAISPIIIFFAIRLFHGMSTGFKPTGTAAYLADIIPENRRGEAMGWLGFAGSLGMALGPKIGNSLHLNYGYNFMFIGSAICAILSVFIFFGLKETLPKSQRTSLNQEALTIRKVDIYEPLVWLPTLIFFLYAFSFGAVYVLIPDKTDVMQIPQHRGNFFLVYVGCTTFSRVIAGKISDRIGRIPVVLFGLILIIISMTTLGFANSLLTLLLGGAFFGIAHGITGPTIFAWTTDWSNSAYRGRAFSTMFIGMEAGIGLGSLTSFAIYNNNPNNFVFAFLLMAFIASVALVILWFKRDYMPKLMGS